MLSLEFLRSVMLYGLAEREGFEPPVPLSTTVFKTVVIDHSTISPFVGKTISPFVGKTSFVFKSECKGRQIFSFRQIFCDIFMQMQCAAVLKVLIVSCPCFGCFHACSPLPL